MNCPECSGATAVVDRRGQKRRRECKVCGHRFNTIEMLAEDAPRAPAPARAAKPPQPRASTTAAADTPVALVAAEPEATPVRQLSARERLERLREERELARWEADL